MKTIAVLTSGGDAPGMNAAIRAIVKVAASRGVRVLGVENGYEGLMDGRFRELTMPYAGRPGDLVATHEVDVMGSLGGTILGSARSARFRTPEGRAAALSHLSDTNGLVVIGGNGSLTGAHLLATEGSTPIMGIPSSIDNDIGCTSTAIGVDTALNTIVDACDRISDTARAHRRAFIVEVMGRHCGYLAIAGAVAVGADAVLFREQGRDDDALVDAIARTIERAFAEGSQKRRVLILKSEGIEMPCTRLVRRVEERISKTLPGVEVRGTVLGHLIRGGTPTFQDRMVAGRMAFAAVDALLQGVSDQMVAFYPPVQGGIATLDPVVWRFPLEHVLRETDALIDGTSQLTQWRVMMMQAIEGVLGL